MTITQMINMNQEADKKYKSGINENRQQDL
jgi:hypothetical protein